MYHISFAINIVAVASIVYTCLLACFAHEPFFRISGGKEIEGQIFPR